MPPTDALLTTAVAIVHWLAGFIVLAEGLNKLERTAPLQPGLTPRARALVLLKVLAWCLLTMGAGGALVRPVLVVAIGRDLHAGAVLLADRVSLVDLFIVGGFAVLIVRSRLKEKTA